MDKRFTFIEIDVDFCNLTYGSAPCTAALDALNVRKCYNTFKTCQDKDNIDLGVLTFRFCTGSSDLPKGQTYFPAVRNIREEDTTVNLAGSDPKLSAFGRRAKVTVDLLDFTYHDRLTDKYQTERLSGIAQTDEAGYDPETRGSFARKLKSRWPHFAGRPLRVIDGTITNGAFVEDQRRHYVLTEFDITKPGAWRFVGKDILDLAKNENALAPAPSKGKLSAKVESDDTSLTLIPSTVGDEYAASGWATIGNEIISFDRAGDVLTLSGRGLLGTEAQTHDVDATVQQCLRVDRERIDTTIETLLTDFAPIPASYIPTSEWNAETDEWAPGTVLDAIITRPTEVSKLIAEIMPIGVSVYWNPNTQKVGYKLNRPIDDDTTWEIADGDILEISRDDRDKERLTEVLFWSQQIDPTAGTDDGNFIRGEFSLDADAKDPRAYGDTKVKKQAIRWLNQGADATVRIASIRYLQRFSEPPTRFKITVKDRKYRAAGLTDVVYLTSTETADVTGNPSREAYQIVSKSRPTSDGEVTFMVQRYLLIGNFGRFSENTYPDYDLATDEEKACGAWFGPNTGDFFSDGSELYEIS